MSSNPFDPSNLPTKIIGGSTINAPFVPSQGRVGTPTNHPAIPQHKDVVITPLMPRPDSAPRTRDIGTDRNSR